MKPFLPNMCTPRRIFQRKDWTLLDRIARVQQLQQQQQQQQLSATVSTLPLNSNEMRGSKSKEHVFYSGTHRLLWMFLITLRSTNPTA